MELLVQSSDKLQALTDSWFSGQVALLAPRGTCWGILVKEKEKNWMNGQSLSAKQKAA
jgi:hypothetical protein